MGKKPGAWCHGSQGKSVFREGGSNNTVECSWEIKEDESRDVLITFGKEEVVGDFDKSSGVVRMKVWFQRDEWLSTTLD